MARISLEDAIVVRFEEWVQGAHTPAAIREIIAEFVRRWNEGPHGLSLSVRTDCAVVLLERLVSLDLMNEIRQLDAHTGVVRHVLRERVDGQRRGTTSHLADALLSLVRVP